ncbi:hypothetical protein ACFSO0_15785 [Brevibacillus sp. GCM10020057]|uniref:hypothetical protein n=1 Tax=Brevibacillus sp. GCM10020057 TaxID=3317327 RepID=UPI00362AEF68
MRITVPGCQSPYPGPGGATPGYLVETDKVRLLLDCGSGRAGRSACVPLAFNHPSVPQV